MTTNPSVVAQLLKDHEEVKALFSKFDTAGTGSWPELFCELTNNLVRHEVAEEEVVYPEVRKSLPGGKALAEARIAEQAEAEKLLDSMEKMDTDSSEFAVSLAKLRDAVLEHATKEEQTVFTPLAQAVEPDKLEELGKRYDKAKALAPTHPHPHAPDTPPGNIFLGPIAALADRVRDAVRKAS